MHNTKLIGPFAQLLTMRGLPAKGAIADSILQVIENGGVLVQDGVVKAADSFAGLQQQYPKVYVEDVPEGMVALPGFIDAHTHLCWGGTRSQDFAARNAGTSYQEIAAAGGGIWRTVTDTRQASNEDLMYAMHSRLERLIEQGITTVEIKTGYGLSVEHELNMLQLIQTLNTETPLDIIPTCLAAHMLPKDFEGDAQAYLQNIITNLVPKVQAEGLCNRFDIFIEDHAFNVEDALWYVQQLKSVGFDITIHGDQFTSGGSKVAVTVGAVSVDHLEVTTQEDMLLIAQSNTVAVALPGASLGIGCAFTPARQLLDAGACLAIASDWNPGSAPMGDLVMQASVLACFQKLSNAEVLAAITCRAAQALNRKDIGQLDNGFKADIVAYDTASYAEILYNQGSLKPAMLWKKGERIL